MSFENAFYTILLAIIGAWLSNYTNPLINRVLSLISSSYKNWILKKRESRQIFINEIASDGTLLQLAAMKCYFFDIAFFLTFIIYLITPPKSLLYMILSLVFGLLSFVAAYRGRQLRKLVNEATDIYKNSLKT